MKKICVFFALALLLGMSHPKFSEASWNFLYYLTAPYSFQFSAHNPSVFLNLYRSATANTIRSPYVPYLNTSVSNIVNMANRSANLYYSLDMGNYIGNWYSRQKLFVQANIWIMEVE